MQLAGGQIQGVTVDLRQLTGYGRAELRDALIHGRVHPAVRTAGPDLDRPLRDRQGPALFRIRGRQQAVQDGRGAQHRVTGEVQFLVLREDPQPGRPARQVHTGQERRLELADFPRQLLHHRRGQVLRIQHHHQAVALQRAPAEDVNMPVAEVKHAPPQSGSKAKPSRQHVPPTTYPADHPARLARRLACEQAHTSAALGCPEASGQSIH